MHRLLLLLLLLRQATGRGRRRRLLLMVTLRFFRNGLIAPLIDHFARGHVAAETVEKRLAVTEPELKEAAEPVR